MNQAPTKVVGRRVGAWAIDALILILLSGIAWLALTESVPTELCTGTYVKINDECRAFPTESARDLWPVINGLVGIAIFWVIQGLTGRTPGKALVGIRVVKADGSNCGIPRAALRSILLIVDGFPYFIPNLVGFIVALNSERNQRVGDMAAGTFVVHKSAASVQEAGQGQGQGQVGGGQYGGPQQGYGPPPPQGAAPAASQQKADWYPDPHGQARLRYWDGQRWTEHTSQ